MPEYLVTLAIQAKSLDAARQTAESWDLGDGEIRSIVGQPEAWAPAPEQEPQPVNGE